MSTATETPLEQLRRLGDDIASVYSRRAEILAEAGRRKESEPRLRRQLAAAQEQRARGEKSAAARVVELEADLAAIPDDVQRAVDEANSLERVEPQLKQQCTELLEKHFEWFAEHAEERLPAWEKARDELLAHPLYQQAIAAWNAAASAWAIAMLGAGLDGIPSCPLPATIADTPRPTRTKRPGNMPSGQYHPIGAVAYRTNDAVIEVLGHAQLQALLELLGSDGRPLFVKRARPALGDRKRYIGA